MNMKTSYKTYEDVYFEVEHYFYDGSLAIYVWNESSGLIATLTKCLNDIFLEENEAYVDTNNCPWALDFIEKEGLGKKTGQVAQRGYCTYPVVAFNLERLKMYMKQDIR